MYLISFLHIHDIHVVKYILQQLETGTFSKTKSGLFIHVTCNIFVIQKCNLGKQNISISTFCNLNLFNLFCIYVVHVTTYK